MTRLAETVPAETLPGHPAEQLSQLRAELDRVDDGLHDGVMRRAEIVGRIAALGVKSGVPLRPGREAAIARRLLARHHGPLPRHGIVRIWRELIAAMTELQQPLVIAVCGADGEAALAREHFGALAAVRLQPSPGQALGEVASGAAAAALLPLPSEEEPLARAWWTGLLHRGAGERRLHVVARVPFWAPRPEGAPRGQGFVISAAPPDPSGEDRTLLALDLQPETSRARLGQALGAAGLEAATVILRRDPGAARALVDVAGFLAEDDPRLAALGPRPTVLGAYAVPVGGDPA